MKELWTEKYRPNNTDDNLFQKLFKGKSKR